MSAGAPGTNEIVEWLSSTDAYDHSPAAVEHLETHISHVFLAGPLVYKLKKRVKFDFVDFSTLSAREHACREEVRLNRRLAPGVYLAVLPIAWEAKRGLSLDGQGEIVDWVVQMRRLPLDQSMLQLHLEGQLRPQHVRRLAKTLVEFYSKERSVAVDERVYRQVFVQNVRDNQQVLLTGLPVQQSLINRVHGFQHGLLQLQPAVLDERVCAGRIFDGHGDLRPEHICFDEPLAIFDCIEFNSALRRIDAADELAFLATECDFIGAAWVEPLLFSLYSEYSGDTPSGLLINFYKAYRASVRAKVAALRASQLTGQPRELMVEEAIAHLRLADRYAASHLRPCMVVVGGLSGSGKSTLATEVADRLGAELLRSDVIRRELASESIRYDRESRGRVYDLMFQRADQFRGQQVPVVVDATFSEALHLQKFRQLSEQSPNPTLFVECCCRPETARQRIISRQLAGTDVSDATPAVLEVQQQSWDAWPANLRHLQVDTEQPLEMQVTKVLAALAAQS